MSLDEFFPGASEWPQDLSRRGFLEMAAASLALAGFTGCTRLPLEKIIPYVQNPEDVIPGRPTFYSSAYVQGGMASGIVVESHTGRPTKIDGNPVHPANFGAASAQQQAFILSLYDQDRSSQVLLNGKKSSWEKCKIDLLQAISTGQTKKGQGLYIISEAISSPTFEDQILQIQKKYPEVRWIQYEPFLSQKSFVASKNVFGKGFQTVYRFDEAETIVCLDADIFGSPLFPLRYAQDFIKKRRASEKSGSLASLFVVEPTPSITGAWTANRLSVKPSEIPDVAKELLFRIENKKNNKSFSAQAESFLQKLITSQSRGSCVFVAGEHAEADVHEICHHLNFKYGNKAVSYIEPTWSVSESSLNALSEFNQDLQNGKVESLFIFGGNIAYDSPASLKISQNLKKVKNIFRFSSMEDETSEVSHWHIPLVHPLEDWSDARAFDGTVSLVQPLIAPLFEGKSPHTILSLFLGAETSAYDAVQNYWRRIWNAKFDDSWREALSEGIVAGTSSAGSRPAKSLMKIELSEKKKIAVSNTVEILFRPDDTVWDGRFGNNPWLQELPKYLSKLTWENAALIPRNFAEKNKVVNGQYLLIETKQGELKVPAWILPGQAEDTITLTFGYGRSKGRIAKGLGYNAYKIWDAENPDLSFGKVKVLNEHTKLASTQTHFTLEGNDIVKKVSLDKKLKKESGPLPSLYPSEPLPPAAEAWAMVIDLDSCIGCSACTVACQSENNIPVVGKEGVLRGREMHWIRVDVYYSESSSNSQIAFQPVPCMHCEKAPCELVCPVAATTHSNEGLNQMVYNRCIGTRYCSNNCPYKVRRFNFLSLNSEITDLGRMQKNPEVSVRSRGVMEKCTYCVQRIQGARIESQRDKRRIRDGEIQTACQATCPTRAISFGDKNNIMSKVYGLRQEARHYALLEDLGVIPRTTYLAKISEGDNNA